MLTRPRNVESGFTLIELVIGMFLLVVVIGFIVSAMTKLGGANSDALANRASQRAALDALETMRSDLRVARSPAHDAWDGRREQLRQVVYFEQDATANDPDDPSRQACSGTPFVECMRDIVDATQTSLWFRADVRRGAGWNGGECVGYVANNTGLTRYLSHDWRGCGPGSGGVADRLIKGDMTQMRFSYVTRAHPNIPVNGIAYPSDCVTSTVNSAPGRTRNFITSVDVDLRGIYGERGESAATGLNTSLVISGRVAGDYAYAVGCSH